MTTSHSVRPLVILAGLTLAAAPVYAQHGGTIELGAFGRYGIYDNAMDLDDAAGWGGRLGFFLSPKVILEGDYALVPTKANGSTLDVDHKPLHVRLVGNFGGEGKRLAFLLGAGWSYNTYSNSWAGAENGIGGLTGLRLSLGKRLSVRGEVLADYMFDQTTSANPTFNYGAQVGVSLMLRGGPGDKDKDGVIDSADKCPNTPKGTKVEATGCPDADGDGVADQVDRCPGTPAGRVVDAIGCTDSDGDGVVDPQDRCPGTPSGVKVDATGCPLDADRDGVPDISDKCPNTPAGMAVDPTTGCPLDQDHDGVADPIDKCPNTPAGTSVDPATGCPVDLDGDGVPDVADRCPNTPAGTAVDANGCPASAPVVLEGVTFVTGSAKLTLASQAPLDRAIAAIRGRTEKFVIEGHTDNVGNRDANIRLSKARADVVRAYFVSKGIPATQITTVGIGPDQPVASNDTPEGRAKNRRVQLRVAP